jgi:acyl carrier protein
MDDQIRSVLAQHGRMPVDVSTLAADDDLYAAGLTSHASVNIMLALEDEFDIEFPDELLRKSTFASIAAIHEVLAQLSDPSGGDASASVAGNTANAAGAGVGAG